MLIAKSTVRIALEAKTSRIKVSQLIKFFKFRLYSINIWQQKLLTNLMNNCLYIKILVNFLLIGA